VDDIEVEVLYPRRTIAAGLMRHASAAICRRQSSNINAFKLIIAHHSMQGSTRAGSWKDS